VILCDTGPLVAAAIANDANHTACVDLFTSLHLAGRPLLVPGLVVAEAGYLLAREGSSRTEAMFLQSLADGDFEPIDPVATDYARMAELVSQYSDLGLGTTDACLVAIAERLNILEIATLDHRHFGVVRPSHIRAFTLLP
jgi:predicted nucleic acid-binding protein